MKLGEAVKAISHEQDRESLAMLNILSLSRKSIDEGNYLPMEEAFAAVRQLVAEDDASS